MVCEVWYGMVWYLPCQAGMCDAIPAGMRCSQCPLKRPRQRHVLQCLGEAQVDFTYASRPLACVPFAQRASL